MKKRILLALTGLFVLGAYALHADGPVTVSEPGVVSPTGGAGSNVDTDQVPTPQWFNGNWFPYSDRSTTDTASIASQTASYKEAKQHGDLENTLANAFWPSVQAWAFNRAARGQIKKADGEHQPDKSAHLNEALTYTKAGLNVLTTVAEVPAPSGSTTAVMGAFKSEHYERDKARRALNSNQLYIERELGLKAWPNGTTEVSK